MNDTAPAYEQVIERFRTWAEQEPDIRAAIIIGSRARIDRPADQWSDLDLVFITTHPARYLQEVDWLHHIGEPWLTFLERTAVGDGMERRVLFEGGLDVDFIPLALEAAQHIEQVGWPPEIAGVVRRGMRVVLDKDGLAHQLSQVPVEPPDPHPPAQHEVLDVINDFLYHAVWTAKKLSRGELWTAKACVDGYMKWRLLRMVEWHAGATRGWSYDTWHGGRFLERWADPRVVEALRHAFARYDRDDIERATLATMDLFRWVAVETTRRLGYDYPHTADERTTALVQELLADSSERASPR